MTAPLRSTPPIGTFVRTRLALLCAMAISLVLATPVSAGGLAEARARLGELERQIALDQATIDVTHETLESIGTKIAELQAAHDATTGTVGCKTC